MSKNNPEWVTSGKSIAALIEDLLSFEDQDLEARISLDGGATSKPISIVKKSGGACLIANSELPE
jgi:hypothetical protein